MALLICIGVCAALVVGFVSRPNATLTIITNLHNIFVKIPIDIFNYIRFKKFNLYSKVGIVTAYCGAFGKGKTLSMIRDARMCYKRYNGKKVWWKGEWRTQFVNIYSNVAINDVPWIQFKSLMDIVEIANKQNDIDDKNHIHTINFICLDEMGAMLNSRDFKNNLNPQVVLSLLQCRKINAKLCYTAQTFNRVDLILRENTHFVVQCNKLWRFMFGLVYDGQEVEYAQNPTLVKPIRDYGWFVLDRDYKSYDTLSQALKVDKNTINSFDTEDETLTHKGYVQGTLDNVTHLSGKGSRRQRKKLL